MHSHIQGVFVLLLIGIALMGLARYAAPVFSEAFGDEGAIIAESAEVEDIVALSAEEIAAKAPLTDEEVAELQANLTTLGFDPGPVDGILGSGTRAAIIAAISQYKLSVDSSSRAVLVYTVSLTNALSAAAAADTPGSEASVESEATTPG